MTRSSISRLLLHILLYCSYKGIAVTDEDNAFTLHFGSESSLQDVQKEVGDAKETLVDVVKSSSNLLEDYGNLVKRFERLEIALGKQTDSVLRKLEAFIEENIAIQSTELLQQLTADQKWLQEEMNAQQKSFLSELQTIEGKLLDKIEQFAIPNEV